MSRMRLDESLAVLRGLRGDDQVVVSTMSAAREWMKLGTHPLDFIYAPSAMGEAPSLGLGLALARPEAQVLVLNGDGCLLMNLGCLVTISAEAPSNLVLFTFENSVYEVTGQQATAASRQARRAGTAVDFCQIARGCGFSAVFEFERLEAWRAEAPRVLAAPGPVFVVLKVAPVPGGEVPRSPAPSVERACAFAQALQTRSPTGAS